MHNFSMLKSGGGQHLTLLRRIAQKAVRHDTQSDCRRAEEVQDNGERYRRRCSGCCFSGRVCKYIFTFIYHNYFTIWCSDSDRIGLRKGRTQMLFRHACGGRNHLLTEVAA